MCRCRLSGCVCTNRVSVLRVLELEEALKSAEHHERVHISKIEEANAAAMARVEEKMERLQRQVDRKDALAAELKRTKQELLSFKRNMRFANFEEASAKAKRAVAEVEALKTELERTKGLLRRARVACGDKDTRIAKMKVEYRELFKAVQEAQREKEDDTDPSLLAAENPHYAEYFRDKLKKKNTEFNEMKARLRRMMSAEIHLVSTMEQTSLNLADPALPKRFCCECRKVKFGVSRRSVRVKKRRWQRCEECCRNTQRG